MLLRKAITLLANSCHNLDLLHMICISFQIHNLYCHSVVKVKKIAVLKFSKLSFKNLKVASAYMLSQSRVIFVYDIYAKQKHRLGCKKYEVNQKQGTSRQVRPKALISAEAKKLRYFYDIQ